MITNFTEKGGASIWPIDHDIIVFHLIFCIGLAVICHALKTALKKKESDKDPVFQSIVCSSILYTALFFTMPPAVFSADSEKAGLFGTLFLTWFQSVVTIFVTGPIKVWLDIKRGQTSLADIRDDM